MAFILRNTSTSLSRDQGSSEHLREVRLRGITAHLELALGERARTRPRRVIHRRPVALRYQGSTSRRRRASPRSWSAGWPSTQAARRVSPGSPASPRDRKSTRLNSSHVAISYAVFCLKKKKKTTSRLRTTTKQKRHH